MDRKTQSRIGKLRASGLGYKRIAAELGVSRNSVASYCLRHGLGDAGEGKKRCAQCRKPIEVDPRHPHRRFCSDLCRARWWNANRGERHPEMLLRRVCPVCGREFSSYGKRERTYCSRGCYDAARKAKGGPGDGG